MSKTNTIKASNSAVSDDAWEFEIANQVPARCSAKNQGLKNTSVNDRWYISEQFGLIQVTSIILSRWREFVFFDALSWLSNILYNKNNLQWAETQLSFFPVVRRQIGPKFHCFYFLNKKNPILKRQDANVLFQQILYLTMSVFGVKRQADSIKPRQSIITIRKACKHLNTRNTTYSKALLR